jgi:hypothetical protein
VRTSHLWSKMTSKSIRQLQRLIVRRDEYTCTRPVHWVCLYFAFRRKHEYRLLPEVQHLSKVACQYVAQFAHCIQVSVVQVQKMLPWIIYNLRKKQYPYKVFFYLPSFLERERVQHFLLVCPFSNFSLWLSRQISTKIRMRLLPLEVIPKLYFTVAWNQ